MKNIIEAMNSRYATKKFDTAKKLSNTELNELLEVLRLSPSSFGLQLWKFVVVANPEIRKELQKASYGQPQVSEASHLIVFTVPKNIDDHLVDEYIKSVAEVRNIPIENLGEYATMIKGFLSGLNSEQRIEWATKQAYIALGVLVASAAVMSIDVAPMEGFDSKKFDELLGLNKMGLVSKVIAAVGFRAKDDPATSEKKVRFPKEKVIIEI
ncbi:hypothetical protein A2645_01410 [Candidatus Nomurabacteria bacterium RIFCSPHIGHO2_01_FULL_39_9]|uniref:Nitroreductase domain-containing protein n=1 Tax=Candidatus Nomurabacteria bacterium RIFCSPHIGHO2_01_FULL_39_9 TaxID=1801735 RepID=A0A1F6UY93_9BACT|nr:MAG: hypothetical protein A2645_01410 [Candidatus Nomurabacteria bacterium RIFCSPHIGHO2_01_FULL_39_9]